MADPPGVVIDPRGDVVLICGEEKRELRVSSAILSHSSPVFSAMLGPNFKEGTKLQDSLPAQLPLPEDDADSMETICQVIHFRRVSDKLEPQAIFKLAVTVNKYNWCDSMQNTARAWLDIGMLTPYLDRCTLLASAYLFQHREMFERISRDIIMDTEGEITFVDGWYPEMVEKWIDMLRRRRELLLSKIGKIVESAIEKLATSATSHNGYCKAVCPYLDARVTALILQLTAAGLWPITTHLSRNVRKQLPAMLAFTYKYPGTDKMCANARCNMGSGCSVDIIPTTLKDEATSLEKQMLKVCLDCVRDGCAEQGGPCSHHDPF